MYEDVVRNIIGGNAIDRAMVESPDTLGKECIGCYRIFPYQMFKPDSSYRDGRRDLCELCANSPRLSTEEHTHRLREMTFNSEAVKRQRWDHQDELRDDAARRGREMWHTDFLSAVQKLVPDLYITEGRIIGDLAIFRTYGQPQPHLEGRDFEYLMFCPTGLIPEFSIYEFDTVRDIPIREKQRGWRTVLLRLIKAGLLTETVAHKHFGEAVGPGSERYNRLLWEFRNRV